MPRYDEAKIGYDSGAIRAMFARVGAERRKSSDPSTRTAAALVSRDGRTVLLAHNAPPPDEVAVTERRLERHLKYAFFEHAERRVIYEAAADGIATRGATMFASHYPCADCARAIIASGIEAVFVDAESVEIGLVSRFFDGMLAATEMFAEAGVSITVFGRNVSDGPSIDTVRGIAAATKKEFVTRCGRNPDESVHTDIGPICRWVRDDVQTFVRFRKDGRADCLTMGSACMTERELDVGCVEMPTAIVEPDEPCGRFGR